MHDTPQSQVTSQTSVSLPAEDLTLLERRNKLAHALQTTLEEGDILGLFYRHLGRIVTVNGMGWCRAGGSPTLLGERATHRLHYNLNLPDIYLGEITFYRKQRFNEREQQTLESLLTSLAFPLRNARRYHQALQLALIDPLTGVGNRSALNRALEREHQLLARNSKHFALIMIDIDRFKTINDRHGHAAGDEVIRQVAETIEQVSRGTDMTFRYGGEEFALLLGDTGTAGGLITAERLRRRIGTLTIDCAGVAVTPYVSLGVSACMDAAEPLEALFGRADGALYRAKQAGRNRVCCEPPATPLQVNAPDTTH